MRRSLWIGVVLGYAVLAVAGPVAMLRESVLGGGRAPTPVVAAGPAQAGEGTTVLMEGLAFAPESLTVQGGSTVVFENLDVAPHTVTSAAAGVDSGVIGPGESFELVVDASLEYLCAIHPGMRARITVAE